MPKRWKHALFCLTAVGPLSACAAPRALADLVSPAPRAVVIAPALPQEAVDLAFTAELAANFDAPPDQVVDTDESPNATIAADSVSATQPTPVELAINPEIASEVAGLLTEPAAEAPKLVPEPRPRPEFAMAETTTKTTARPKSPQGEGGPDLPFKLRR